MVGVDLPVEPLRRQILITEPIPGLDPRTPFTIDFATSFYFHGEGRGLLLGMSDPRRDARLQAHRVDEWLPGLGDVIERRAPAHQRGRASRAGWAGLYEMTPDHNALIGEAEGVSRFLYATGFSGHGFLMGPADRRGDARPLPRPARPSSTSAALERHAASPAPLRPRARTVRPELNIV